MISDIEKDMNMQTWLTMPSASVMPNRPPPATSTYLNNGKYYISDSVLFEKKKL